MLKLFSKPFMNKEETIRRITGIDSLTAIVSQLAKKSGLNDVNKVANIVTSSIERGALKKEKIYSYVL
jgi:hypothetical protein